jgi:hypothetical protein
LQEIGVFYVDRAVAGGMVVTKDQVPPKPPVLVVSGPVEEVELAIEEVPEVEDEKPRRCKMLKCRRK